MWSIAAIVGLATATSSILLFVGVLIAVKIERRRYRRYLERHTAGRATDDRLDSERSVEDHEDARVRRMSMRKSTLQNSSLTWMTLPSCEALNGHAQAVSQHSSSETTLAEKKPLTTAKIPMKKRKKKAERRRLKRTTPRRPALNSPLSAITETSNCSPLSPNVEKMSISSSPPQPSAEDVNGDGEGWQIPITKRRDVKNHNSMIRTHSFSPGATVPRPIDIRRSISLTNSLSTMPASPPPPLPTFTLHRSCRSLAASHVSESSMESVGSSLLHSVTSSPVRPIMISEKHTSHALQDFVFDLDHVASSDPRKCAYAKIGSGKHKLTVASSTGSFESQPNAKEPSHGDTEHITARTGTQAGALTDRTFTKSSMTRHSVGELRKLFSGDVEAIAPESTKPKAELFPPNVQTSFASTGARMPLQDLDLQSVVQRDYVCAIESANHDWRSERINITQHTSSSPTPKNSVRSRIPIPAAHRNGSDSSKSRQIANNFLPRVSSSLYSIKQFEGMRPAVDTTSHSGLRMPATPESSSLRPWRFDFVPIDTPSSHQPSPLKLRNSPILPPPILCPPNMFPYPRRSPVCGPRGPRGPRGHSQSPLKTKTKGHGGGQSEKMPHSTVQPPPTSIPMHKSVALLRHMSSEMQLLDMRGGGESDKENQRPIAAPFLLSSSSVSLRPTSPSTFLKVPGLTIDTKSRILSSRSPTSEAGETSIWEDISIREDSPLSSPELEFSGSQAIEDYRDCTMNNSGVSTETPRAQIQDYEMYERFVNNYGKVSTIAQEMAPRNSLRSTTDHQESVPCIGLGLGMGTARASAVLRATVPDTRGSLYDANGFLKD